MKVKIFQHSGLKINYADDLPKVVAFFKSKGIDVEFSAPQITNVLLRDCPPNLYLPNDNKEQEVLMYIFDRSQRAYSYALNFSQTLQVIEISTATFDDAVDYTWKLISHELVHTLFKRLRNQNVFLDDPMDSMLVNGAMQAYYKNETPYAPDGNFAEAFKRLQPYWNKLFPPTEVNYFKTQEFVPKSVYDRYKENSIWFIDPRIIKLANFTRTFFGKSVTINNWLWGGGFNERGFREPESTTGAKLSQHRFGRAIDINVAGMTHKAVYDTILANEKAFMDAGLTTLENISDTPGWVHMDCRQTGSGTILIVSP